MGLARVGKLGQLISFRHRKILIDNKIIVDFNILKDIIFKKNDLNLKLNFFFEPTG